MEALMKEIIHVLHLIASSLGSISLCLWLMLFCKDMGHDAANAIRSWRMQWNK